MAERPHIDAEAQRLAADARREKNWKRWGPYLAERQWGTVREDYSPDGSCWEYFPHEQPAAAPIAGAKTACWGSPIASAALLCPGPVEWPRPDPQGALVRPDQHRRQPWRGREGVLLLSGCHAHVFVPEGPLQVSAGRVPLRALVEENHRRSRKDPEFELLDTGVFDGDRYFDVFVEYAKSSPNDILIRITAANRGPEAATLHLLPTVWFRNTWSWGCLHEGCTPKPELRQAGEGAVLCEHPTLGRFHFHAPGDPAAACRRCCLPTTNEQRTAFPGRQRKPLCQRRISRLRHPRADGRGQSCGNRHESRGALRAGHRRAGFDNRELRLFAEEEAPREPFDADFDRVFADRVSEADEFYRSRIPPGVSETIAASAGRRMPGCSGRSSSTITWSRSGSKAILASRRRPPAAGRPQQGLGPPVQSRRDLHARQVGVPRYAAWDSAFHMIPMAEIDPAFPKEQLILSA